ncbi:MAG: MarC family protein [Puniceicoccales bacterium]|jgi:multiple antibiotic resistance protein|nr:MarC family protein [Puniceicoccales bacterium]
MPTDILQSNFEYFTKYFIKLFTLISPLAVIALFISATAPLSKNERMKAAKMGSAVAYFAMLAFALTGRKIFELFGITIGALYVGGGIIIFLMALSMLNAKDVGEQDGGDEIAHEAGKKSRIVASDIAVTPIGIPVICGPCSITTIIILQDEACGTLQKFIGLGALTLVALSIYFMLIFCAHGAKWLTPSVLKLSYKLTGIILVMMAVEMFISGLRHEDLQVLEPKQTIVKQEIQPK